MSEENEESQEIREDSETGRGRVVWMLVAVGVLILGGAAGWRSHAAKASAKIKGAPPAPPVVQVVHLESFLVNLGDPSRDSFLRIGIDLGLDRGPSKAGGGEQVATPTAQIRDTILAVVTSSDPDVLLFPEGKSKLKQQLLTALQSRLPQLGVREVYLTDFLVQR